MIEEPDSRRKEPSIALPPMKTGTIHVNEEREKVFRGLPPKENS